MMNTKRILGFWAWAMIAVAARADDFTPGGFQTGPATDFVSPAVVKPADADNRVRQAHYTREEPEKKEQYLLLNDRSIVAGFITVADTHYVVERHGAKILFDKKRVQAVGDSVADLYVFQAERIPVHDLPMRATLAQWCFDKGLIEEAMAEAKLIQSIDPNQVDAERVVRLCRTKVRSEDPEASDRAVSRRLRQPDPGRVVNQFKSAYGQDLFDYYKDFEGMLVASCGNAACHGSARHEGPFRIYRRTFNTNDSQVQTVNNDIKLTARNLMSILDSIDYRDPLRSPLLHKALERHGSSSLPPLGGVQDPTYMKLQEWVLAVSDRWSGNDKEIDPRLLKESLEEDAETFAGGRMEGPNSTLIIRRTARPQTPVLQAGDEIERVRHSPPLADDAPELKATPTEPMPRKETPAGADPYDPSEFNNGETKPSPGHEKPSVPSGNVQTSSKQRSKLLDLVDTQDGKPVVRRSMGMSSPRNYAEAKPFDGIPTDWRTAKHRMQVDKTGRSTFEAAMPPLSLAPGFRKPEQRRAESNEKD